MNAKIEWTYDESLPSGYRRPTLPGTGVVEYLSTHLLVCRLCGAAVLDTEMHDAWHRVSH